MRNQCLDMRFKAEVTVPSTQAVRLRSETDLALAAMSEPFAVCLHAIRKAGSLVGKRVLVSCCGPIGCLTIVAAGLAGASEIIATDIAAAPLGIAEAAGATETIDLGTNLGALDRYRKGKGQIDVALECSGAVVALQAACGLVRPREIIVTVGLAAMRRCR